MPAGKVFIDSTTFLYSHDVRSAPKRARARAWLERLIETDLGQTNLQVLNEVTNVLIRKAYQFHPGDPFAKVDVFADFGSTAITLGTVALARAVHDRYRYSWWDCLLLASAIELGCTHFLSEDLQDGQAIGALTIVDPFAHGPEEILASAR